MSMSYQVIKFILGEKLEYGPMIVEIQAFFLDCCVQRRYFHVMPHMKPQLTPPFQIL